MHISTEVLGDVTVLVLEGSLDAQAAAEVAEAIQAEIAAGRLHLVLNLSGVGFMSSAGLRVILAGAQAARGRHGDIRLAEANSNVKRVLGLSGFTQVMQHYDAEATAVESFAG